MMINFLEDYMVEKIIIIENYIFLFIVILYRISHPTTWRFSQNDLSRSVPFFAKGGKARRATNRNSAVIATNRRVSSIRM